MSELDQWAEEHKKRAAIEQTMNSIRRLWNQSGMGKTLLMSGPAYEIVMGVDFGRDEGSVTTYTLAGEQKQQQEQKDGSEGTVEVHDAQPG